MFGRKKEDPGPVIEARAIVTDVRDTGATVNNNPRVELTLRVEPDGAEAWNTVQKVTVSRIHIPKTGDPFTVKYFERHPEGLRVQRRTAEELAAAAGAAPGPPAAPAPAPPAAPAPPPPDPLERIAKLQQLREAGALTEEEFAEQKAKLLAEI